MKKFAVLGLVALIAAPAALAAPNGSWLPEAQQFNRQAVRSKDESARQADCDRDCNNIDLTLKSADGNVIKADTEDDDAPMFSWRANRTGRYTLSVAIPGCHTDSGCKYSGQVFVGNRDIFAD